MMSRDRRRHLRVVPEPGRPIEVQIMGPGYLEIVDATNIAVAGVGVFIPHWVASEYVDTPVEIILTLPRCRPVHLRGIIRHYDDEIDPARLGIEFVRLPPKVRDLLERYVAQNRDRLYSPPGPASG